MAKQHFISERMWVDEYVAELDPTEKLLFIYLLTNYFMNCYGIYDIPLRNIAFDTGIDKDAVLRIMDRFDRDNKISYYKNKTIVIRNYWKYQSYNLPDVRNFVLKQLQELPSEIREAYPDVIQNLTNVALPSDTPATTQSQPRRRPATTQPAITPPPPSTSSTTSSSPPPPPPPSPRNTLAAPGRKEDEEEEGKKGRNTGGDPRTPPEVPDDKTPREWDTGVWLTDAEALKYKQRFPDNDPKCNLITIAREVSVWAEGRGEQLKRPLSTCLKFAQTKMGSDA